MIASIDESVRRITKRLDELKLAERTVVIFASDNGGVGGYAEIGGKGVTDNAPLRGGKGMLYEGGLRVPFIVRWPGVVKPGTTCGTPTAHVDLFPTLLEIAGVAERPAQTLDGLSIAPLLRDPAASLPREAVYGHLPGYLEGYRTKKWRTTPAGFVRSGDWKLLEYFEDGRLELYNVREDPGETKDLTPSHPERARELQDRLAKWRREVGAAMPSKKKEEARATDHTVGGPLGDYFRAETARLQEQCLAEVESLDDWNALKSTYRAELLDMLGLSPLPPRGDLKAVVTGAAERDSFRVEKLCFQSLPGLYVTGNLYVPRGLTGPAPAVLYLCGHGPVVIDGTSYGNKVTYQHHGAWLAEHGYVALLIDTLQLGEIQGLHHGTYREEMWWWNSRGYTPAGVEAWNAMRAIDYLYTRSEVDRDRIGVTGRSGGGAYSWWITAIDDRVRVAAPVAGVTDLDDHVVRGCVEGHCDCMYIVNTYRWDYPQVAALAAPRALLIVNTDDDGIFPLGGVHRTYERVRRIYELHGARDKLGLSIGPGPHKDTQDLQVPVLRWLDKHLRGAERPIESSAKKPFLPQELKVLAEVPADQINTTIHDRFVPRAAAPAVPGDPADWALMRDGWLAALREKTFGGWPVELAALEVSRASSAPCGSAELETFDFTSQEHVRLRLSVLRGKPPVQVREVVLHVAAEPPAWSAVDASQGTAHAHIAPRGLGLAAWSGDAKKQVQLRRRFLLLGQTLDGMRVWDIRRALQAVRSLDGLGDAPLRLVAAGDLACDALYASLFEPPADLELAGLPASHDHGPDFLNVLRILDVPQAVAMALERSRVTLRQDPAGGDAWSFPVKLAERLKWPAGRFVVVLPEAPATPAR